MVCSTKHLPGFVALADKIKAAGADAIFCIRQAPSQFPFPPRPPSPSMRAHVAITTAGQGAVARARASLRRPRARLRHGLLAGGSDSVNDAFVMDAWGKAHDATDKVAQRRSPTSPRPPLPCLHGSADDNGLTMERRRHGPRSS